MCLEDGQIICSDCVVFGDHQGHPVILLTRLVTEAEEQLAAIREMAQPLSQQLALPDSNSKTALLRNRLKL
jgi:hypothetical protein